MKHEIQFVTNCGAAFWLISLLLLQTDYSRQAAAGPNDSSPPVTTPSTSPSTIAIAPRLSPSPGNWVNVTSNLAGMTSECGNMTFVSAKPNEDLMIAGVARRGLWGSRDGGMSWHQLGSGSATIINRTGSIIYDPARPEVFWESGIYNSNGVYRTDDNGSVFRALGSARHNDSVSVDFTDRNRRTLLAGGHEQKQTVYRSQDGGNTWINVGVNLPAGTAFSSYPLVVNSRIFFVGCFPSWGGGTGGIYQSNDSGATWSSVSAQGGGAEPLVASDGSIYWPSGDGSMVRGTNDASNWTWKQTVASGTLMNVHPIELPDGRIVSLSFQHIMISSDHGVHWQVFGPQLPFRPVGISYSDFDKSFYIWQFDCGSKVLPNAILKIWL